jgi:hypothetical protein
VNSLVDPNSFERFLSKESAAVIVRILKHRPLTVEFCEITLAKKDFRYRNAKPMSIQFDNELVEFDDLMVSAESFDPYHLLIPREVFVR